MQSIRAMGSLSLDASGDSFDSSESPTRMRLRSNSNCSNSNLSTLSGSGTPRGVLKSPNTPRSRKNRNRRSVKFNEVNEYTTLLSTEDLHKALGRELQRLASSSMDSLNMSQSFDFADTPSKGTENNSKSPAKTAAAATESVTSPAARAAAKAATLAAKTAAAKAAREEKAAKAAEAAKAVAAEKAAKAAMELPPEALSPISTSSAVRSRSRSRSGRKTYDDEDDDEPTAASTAVQSKAEANAKAAAKAAAAEEKAKAEAATSVADALQSSIATTGVDTSESTNNIDVDKVTSTVAAASDVTAATPTASAPPVVKTASKKREVATFTAAVSSATVSAASEEVDVPVAETMSTAEVATPTPREGLHREDNGLPNPKTVTATAAEDHFMIDATTAETIVEKLPVAAAAVHSQTSEEQYVLKNSEPHQQQSQQHQKQTQPLPPQQPEGELSGSPDKRSDSNSSISSATKQQSKLLKRPSVVGLQDISFEDFSAALATQSSLLSLEAPLHSPANSFDKWLSQPAAPIVPLQQQSQSQQQSRSPASKLQLSIETAPLLRKRSSVMNRSMSSINAGDYSEVFNTHRMRQSLLDATGANDSDVEGDGPPSPASSTTSGGSRQRAPPNNSSCGGRSGSSVGGIVRKGSKLGMSLTPKKKKTSTVITFSLREELIRIRDTWSTAAAAGGCPLPRSALNELNRRIEKSGSKKEKPKLSFVGCGLDDEQVKLLVTALAERPVVEKLELSNNRISSESAKLLRDLQGCQVQLAKLLDPMNRMNAIFLAEVGVERSKERIERQLLEELKLLSASLRRTNAQNSIRKCYLDFGAPFYINDELLADLWAEVVGRPDQSLITAAMLAVNIIPPQAMQQSSKQWLPIATTATAAVDSDSTVDTSPVKTLKRGSSFVVALQQRRGADNSNFSEKQKQQHQGLEYVDAENVLLEGLQRQGSIAPMNESHARKLEVIAKQFDGKPLHYDEEANNFDFLPPPPEAVKNSATLSPIREDDHSGSFLLDSPANMKMLSNAAATDEGSETVAEDTKEIVSAAEPTAAVEAEPARTVPGPTVEDTSTIQGANGSSATCTMPKDAIDVAADVSSGEPTEVVADNVNTEVVAADMPTVNLVAGESVDVAADTVSDVAARGPTFETAGEPTEVIATSMSTDVVAGDVPTDADIIADAAPREPSDETTGGSTAIISGIPTDSSAGGVPTNVVAVIASDEPTIVTTDVAIDLTTAVSSDAASCVPTDDAAGVPTEIVAGVPIDPATLEVADLAANVATDSTSDLHIGAASTVVAAIAASYGAAGGTIGGAAAEVLNESNDFATNPVSGEFARAVDGPPTDATSNAVINEATDVTVGAQTNSTADVAAILAPIALDSFTLSAVSIDNERAHSCTINERYPDRTVAATNTNDGDAVDTSTVSLDGMELPLLPTEMSYDLELSFSTIDDEDIGGSDWGDVVERNTAAGDTHRSRDGIAATAATRVSNTEDEQTSLDDHTIDSIHDPLTTTQSLIAESSQSAEVNRVVAVTDAEHRNTTEIPENLFGVIPMSASDDDPFNLLTAGSLVPDAAISVSASEIDIITDYAISTDDVDDDDYEEADEADGDYDDSAGEEHSCNEDSDSVFTGSGSFNGSSGNVTPRRRSRKRKPRTPEEQEQAMLRLSQSKSRRQAFTSSGESRILKSKSHSQLFGSSGELLSSRRKAKKRILSAQEQEQSTLRLSQRKEPRSGSDVPKIVTRKAKRSAQSQSDSIERLSQARPYTANPMILQVLQQQHQEQQQTKLQRQELQQQRQQSQQQRALGSTKRKSIELPVQHSTFPIARDSPEEAAGTLRMLQRGGDIVHLRSWTARFFCRATVDENGSASFEELAFGSEDVFDPAAAGSSSPSVDSVTKDATINDIPVDAADSLPVKPIVRVFVPRSIPCTLTPYDSVFHRFIRRVHQEPQLFSLTTAPTASTSCSTSSASSSVCSSDDSSFEEEGSSRILPEELWDLEPEFKRLPSLNRAVRELLRPQPQQKQQSVYRKALRRNQMKEGTRHSALPSFQPPIHSPNHRSVNGSGGGDTLTAYGIPKSLITASGERIDSLIAEYNAEDDDKLQQMMRLIVTKSAASLLIEGHTELTSATIASSIDTEAAAIGDRTGVSGSELQLPAFVTSVASTDTETSEVLAHDADVPKSSPTATASSPSGRYSQQRRGAVRVLQEAAGLLQLLLDIATGSAIGLSTSSVDLNHYRSERKRLLITKAIHALDDIVDTDVTTDEWVFVLRQQLRDLRDFLHQADTLLSMHCSNAPTNPRSPPKRSPNRKNQPLIAASHKGGSSIGISTQLCDRSSQKFNSCSFHEEFRNLILCELGSAVNLVSSNIFADFIATYDR